MESLFDIQNNIIEILKSKIKLSTREARIEARFILEHELKMKHASLISNQLLPIKQKNKNKIYKILEERIQHKPLAHIIGEWEFYGLNFFVSQETLIPRQDTELLIDLVLKKYPPKQEINILDLGTGSGIIGITLAKKIPKSHILISDVSLKALKVAEKNILNFKLKNIRTIQSNWFKNIPPKKFDVIISNPPYIDEESSYLNNPELSYEPKIALISKNNGLKDISHIIEESPNFLSKKGRVFIEHGFDQSGEINSIFLNNNFTKITQHKDLNKIIRVSSGEIKN